jgi:hypothetical protein
MPSPLRTSFVLLCCGGLLLAAGPVSAGDPAAERVLVPESAARLQEALGEPAAGLVLDGAQLEAQGASVTFCRGDGGCWGVRLEAPSAACGGRGLPAACLAFDEGVPEAEQEAVAAALSGLEVDDLWQRPGALERQEEDDWAALGQGKPGWPPLPVLLFSFAIPLGFLLLGAGAGWLLKRFRGRPLAAAWLPPLFLLVPLLPVCLVPYAWLGVAAWDAVVWALALGFGGFLTAHRWGLPGGAARYGLLLAGLLVGLLLAEGAVRLLMPAPPAFPVLSADLLTEQRGMLFPADGEPCRALFAASTEGWEARGGGLDRPLRVVHVGDSMVEGVGVRPEETFVAELNRRTSEVAHVNGGFNATAPDFYFALTRRWAALFEPDLVVWYLFLANDFSDHGLGEYGCCGGGRLIDVEAEGVEDLCPELSEVPVDGENRFAVSPVPTAVRAATGFSWLARYALWLLRADLVESALPESAYAPALARTERLLATARRELDGRGIAFAAVVLPARASLEDVDGPNLAARELTAEILRICERTGVTCLDPWEHLVAAVREAGVPPWFGPAPDFHFSPAGHRRFADWLETELPALQKRK